MNGGLVLALCSPRSYFDRLSTNGENNTQPVLRDNIGDKPPRYKDQPWSVNWFTGELLW